LVDQWTSHFDADEVQALENGPRGLSKTDEHDDTPILQKLFLLARNPVIASKVKMLTHRCHLPMPNIFDELPYIQLHAENLSHDRRIHDLLRLAMRNMVNVHTLHIIYGHMKLASSLVAGFLDQSREGRVPLRRLWIESCALTPHALHALASSKVGGLQSLRIRRLHCASSFSTGPRSLVFNEYRLSRGGTCFPVHGGAGNWLRTSVQCCPEGMSDAFRPFTDAELMHHAEMFDRDVYSNLPEIQNFIDGHEQLAQDDMVVDAPANALHSLFMYSAPTLTSLNLDWILWRRKGLDDSGDATTILQDLATLRFPHLQAFQVRNAVLPETMMPSGVYLLEDTFLRFLEYHKKLQCLAWPADRWYGETRPSVDVQNRVRILIAHLASVLTDLRVDAAYVGMGEPLTDWSETPAKEQERKRRRRFIAEFAPHMRQIKRIKMEGGIPRDEKREILRALHYCPLKKVVIIGVSFPAGNTWGANGLDLKAVDDGSNWDDMHDLEAEDAQGIAESIRHGSYIPREFVFQADYGWPAIQQPLLRTLLVHHASTVEELKLCGYHGAPILSHLTPITDILLTPLRNCDNLKQLVISFWLLTWFEGDYRDAEIIKFWTDSRSPSSTALVVVPRRSADTLDHPVDPGLFPLPNAEIYPPPQYNRWAVALKTNYSPSALAYRVASDIGPYLSSRAKSRPGGVLVRASFCIGVKEESRSSTDIFDMDVRIGAGDQVSEFKGPREESEPSRWWQKLENRSWF